MSNASGLVIYAYEPTSCALDKDQRRPPRTAADIENPAGPIKSEEFGNFCLLGCGAPTLLPDILAKRFTPHRSGDIAVEGSILDGVKVCARIALN
jgi:hypothetical protein